MAIYLRRVREKDPLGLGSIDSLLFAQKQAAITALGDWDFRTSERYG